MGFFVVRSSQLETCLLGLSFLCVLSVPVSVFFLRLAVFKLKEPEGFELILVFFLGLLGFLVCCFGCFFFGRARSAARFHSAGVTLGWLKSCFIRGSWLVAPPRMKQLSLFSHRVICQP